VLCAYGGAGPLHATSIARELGIREVVVPLGDLASGWSAFGVARSNALAIEERPVALHAPFDMDALREIWASLRAEAHQRLSHRGVDDIVVQHLATLKYELQTSELTIDAGAASFDTLSSEELVARFGAEYDRLYGQGTGYAAAGVALTSLSVTARAQHHSWEWSYLPDTVSVDSTDVKIHRPVVWYELGAQPQLTPIYDRTSLRPGMAIQGPAVVELPNTTISIRPDQLATLDPAGNVVVRL
jgi:N-methylhydantoinase A